MTNRLKQISVGWLALYLLMGVALVETAHGKAPCDYPAVPTRHAAGTTRFLVFGDSGTGAPGQYRLASQMEATRKTVGFNKALMLGDNLYPKGALTEVEPRFERPYAELLKSRVRFYPVLGNHDVQADEGRGQMAYFRMPGRWYSFLDGPTQFFMLESNRTHVNYEQLNWLNRTLSSSSAPWKVVATHHPIYSSGKHGSVWWMKIFVEPLLVKYKVDIVLSGHDHHYERIKPQRGVAYFISGGGGDDMRPIKSLKPYSEVALAVPHFLVFELGYRTGWFQAVNICGRVIDNGALKPNVGYGN